MNSTLTKHQVKTYGPKIYTEDGTRYKLTAKIRYDDECGNGHNTLTITGEQYRQAGNGRWVEDCFGCMHETIAKHFPELRPYLKWHLCSSDGPTHYLENTLYHASDKDCWDLRKGEQRQLKSGRTKLPVWEAVVYDKDGEAHPLPTYSHPWVDAETQPSPNGDIHYRAYMTVGDGKEPDLEAARSSAIWPDATLEQLQDKAQLEARLPGLIAEFRQAVESLGFTF